MYSESTVIHYRASRSGGSELVCARVRARRALCIGLTRPLRLPPGPPQWLLRSALKQPGTWMRKYIPPRIHSPITPAPGETFNPPQDGEANPTWRASPGAPRPERQPAEARRREMNGTIKRLKQKDERKKREGREKKNTCGGGEEKKERKRGRHWLCALKPDRSGISKDKPS